MRPNYFIFIGYLKMGGGGGEMEGDPPLRFYIEHICIGLQVVSNRKTGNQNPPPPQYL